MKKIKLKETLIENIHDAIKKRPAQIALTWVDEEGITYEKLGLEIERIAKLLDMHGIKHGDKVAILSQNSPNWCISYLAIISLGAIVVPILTEFHENEIHHILRHSESKAIFVSERLYPKFEAMLGNGIDLAFDIESFERLEPESTFAKLKSIYQEQKRLVTKRTSRFSPTNLFRSSKISGKDVVVIIYTSGTTGKSKGVMLTNENLVQNVEACYSVQPMDENDRLISILPLPHTYEATLGFLYPLMFNCALHYIKKAPTPRVLLPALAKVRPTIMLTVPLIIEKIFRNKVLPTFTSNKFVHFLYKIPFFRVIFHKIAGKKLMTSFGGCLKFFGVGGAPLAPDVERFLFDSSFPYSIGYGLTETSPLLAGSHPSKMRYRSTGPIVYKLKHLIINKNPKTNEGEIVVRGKTVMKKYYKAPKQTEEAFITINGKKYFRTGDLGLMKNGYLYIKGRLKNVILGPSGENIYPEEIEAVINESELVNESIVYENNHKLTAKIHLNYELIDDLFKSHNYSESKLKEEVDNILNKIKLEVNSKVSSFSRLSKVVEQMEPFEKTPTMKIKRYLYV